MDQGPLLKTCWDFGSCLKGWALAGCSEFCNWGDLKSVEWCFLRWEQIVTITQEDLLSFTYTVLRCMICQCLWFLAGIVASVKTLWQNLDTNFQHEGRGLEGLGCQFRLEVAAVHQIPGDSQVRRLLNRILPIEHVWVEHFAAQESDGSHWWSGFFGSEVTNRSAASLVWRDQYPPWIYLMLMAYVRSLYCFCSEAKLSEFSWKLCTAPFQRSWIAMFGWWPSLESIQGWCCRGDCGGSSGVSHAARNFGMDGWPVCIAQQWGSMSCYQVSPKLR